jgi:DNA-directed RNA polymerase specialized sigma24 family protein
MPTGFSYEEATAICESAVGTIKSRVTSARTQLWVVGQPIKADQREAA